MKLKTEVSGIFGDKDQSWFAIPSRHGMVTRFFCGRDEYMFRVIDFENTDVNRR